MKLDDETLDALDEDGAVVKLDDGTALRVRIEPDYDTNINDFDCYGAVEPASTRYNDYEEGPRRPDGFDGNAEKIEYARGAWMWWQPPADIPRTDPAFPKFRDAVRDILEMGFSGVILERLDGTDAYGRDIVTDVASLWGIDSLADSYLREVVKDLAHDLA